MSDRCHCGCRHSKSDIRANMTCGHPTAATMRMRPLTCNRCGCPMRMTRSWLAINGEPTCGCGGTFRCECIDDRCCLPGEEGRAAMIEWEGRATQFGVASEVAQKASATKSRRARARKAPRVRNENLRRDHTGLLVVADMPF